MHLTCYGRAEDKVPGRLDPAGPTPAEVQARLNAMRAEEAFVIFRDEHRHQAIVPLDPARRVTLGRSPTVDVDLSWDPKVSRVHALLECVGGVWMLSDDGLSSNGTFCNHERVHGRRRLEDGDTLRLGDSTLMFRDPKGSGRLATVNGGTRVAIKLSDTQRRVLVALCRPFIDPSPFTLPATNQDIGDELHLGVDAVKAHLRVLFEKFGIEQLPQQHKRGRLAELALEQGVISERDLAEAR